MSRILPALFILLISSPALPFSFELNSFLSKVEKNQITFQQGTILNAQGRVLEMLIKNQKVKYPQFKDNMIFYHSVLIGDTNHVINFDWTANECVHTTINIGGSAEDIKKQIVLDYYGNIIDRNKTVIPMKICEKLYNFYYKK